MKKSKLGTYYTLPIALWLIVFFAIPMVIVLAYAFLKKGTYGGVEMELSLASFYIFTDKVFLTILFKTVYISIMVTIFTVLLSIPTAYYIARSKYKKELLFLVIIPFWTNFLIRIYAWIAVLGNNGFLNNVLLKLGIIDAPLQLLYNTGAVILTNREAFFKVFIPNIKPGIITAVLFTFIPALGSYAVPKLVGGTQATMLGNIIAQHLTVTRNWPLASTISAALIIVTSIAILLFMKLSNKETKLEVVAEDE